MPEVAKKFPRRMKLSWRGMAQILDGNRVRDEIKSELKPRVEALAAAGRPPGLAVVLAGNNPASEIYVRNKIKACHDLGIYSESITPDDSVTTDDLLALVDSLNHRADIDGILVQLPLPKQVDTKRILLAVDPAKDVDGFHPCNVGRLVAGLPGPKACTPAGILQILKRYGVAISGKRAVVVGRSDIVGKPVAFLLLQEHATVTICHSKTPNLAAVCREGDILVAAMGRAAMLTAEYIKPGATVIDVGTNRVDSREEAARIFRNSAERLAAFDKRGNLLVGDVHPLDVAEVASAYTPVPGGVGPLTIAMLMANTVEAAEIRSGRC
jgi:methylenetetrahydrofolate dehydrogenase (NADP+) / methenyltetrahydrofolate cyclohydrolase